MQTVDEQARRILVVDDNDAIHGDFRKILVDAKAPSKLAGAKAKLFGPVGGAPAAPAAGKVRFEVDSALQGEEGLGRLRQAAGEGRPYSVAFVDMRMPPGWDGLQTIQKLWEVDPDLQVVICSAYSDHSWDEISATLGLTDRLLILRKPFDPVEVTQLATALSEKWALRRAAKLKMDELERMVRERTAELTHLAMHDKLTGLPNRAMFNEQLAAAVARRKVDPGAGFAVYFLDFDRFKVVNDSLGHDAGDQLLKAIAGRLEGALRLARGSGAAGEWLAARLGGDEFVVLAPGLDAAAEFADGLLRLLATPYQVGGREVHSTASIGITTGDLKYERAEDALRDADTAMYHAKAAGKARCVVFDPAMHAEAVSRLEVENDLRGAIERRELELYYQPIISLADGRIEGFEALVRWNHPKRGLIPPLQFIPYCEESGLIVPFGHWIMGKACQQLKAWTRKYPHLAGMTMSVNLSAGQLADPNLIGQIRHVVEAAGIDSRQLVLEITESLMASDLEGAVQTMKQIRAEGVRLHMDDFGTGYSSLSCLHRFPLNGLKIDRSFIRNVGEHRDYAAVIHAIVCLARNLGFRLVAEGIETAEQVAMLQAMECDFAQGYYFDRPRDVAGAEAFIEKRLPAAAA